MIIRGPICARAPTWRIRSLLFRAGPRLQPRTFMTQSSTKAGLPALALALGLACAVCTGKQVCQSGQGVDSTCAGCVSQGACLAGTSASACGQNGATCIACSSGGACANGQCSGGSCQGCVDANGACQPGTAKGA